MPPRGRRPAQQCTTNARVPSSADEVSASSVDGDAEMKTPSPRRRLRRDAANRKVDFAVGASKRRNIDILNQAKAKCVAVIDELRAEREVCVNYDLQTAVADFLTRHPREWQDKTLDELENLMFSDNPPGDVGEREHMPLLKQQFLLKTIPAAAAAARTGINGAGGSHESSSLLEAAAVSMSQIMSGMDVSHVTNKKSATSSASAVFKTIAASDVQAENRTRPLEPFTNDEVRATAASTEAEPLPPRIEPHAQNVEFGFAVPLPPPQPKTSIKQQASDTADDLAKNKLTTPTLITRSLSATTTRIKTTEVLVDGSNTAPPFYSCLVHASCAVAVKKHFQSIPDLLSNAFKFSEYPDTSSLPRAAELFRLVRQRVLKIMPPSSSAPSSSSTPLTNGTILLLLVFPDILPNKDGGSVNVLARVEILLREFSKIVKDSGSRVDIASSGSASEIGPPVQCVAGFVAAPLSEKQVRTAVTGDNAGGGDASKAVDQSAGIEQARALQTQLTVMYGALQARQSGEMFILDGLTVRKVA